MPCGWDSPSRRAQWVDGSAAAPRTASYAAFSPSPLTRTLALSLFSSRFSAIAVIAPAEMPQPEWGQACQRRDLVDGVLARHLHLGSGHEHLTESFAERLL